MKEKKNKWVRIQTHWLLIQAHWLRIRGRVLIRGLNNLPILVRASCANHEFVVTGYEFIPSDPKFRPNGSEFGVTGILKYHIFQFS